MLTTFNAVVINNLILFISLNFVSLAVKVVALKVYLIINRWTYHLLLFGGAHLERVSYLEVALRILRYLGMLCCSLAVLVLLSLRKSLRYLMSDLHVLDPYRNIVGSLRLFLLVRLHALLNLSNTHRLVQSTIGCLLDLRSIVTLWLMSRPHCFNHLLSVRLVFDKII
jgi:hypothetical protein